MTVRVYSQRFWPGVGPGPLDDCWVLASFMAIHDPAPWIALPGVKKFRELAGRPDSPTLSDGGNEFHMAKGIRGVAPLLKIDVASGMAWPTFVDKVKAGHACALIVRSAVLPAALRFGFDGIHAVTVRCTPGGVFVILNPLDDPHSIGDEIEQKRLRRAVEGYDTKGVHGVLMPRPAQAFRTHPLYVPPMAPDPDCVDAMAAGVAEGYATGVDDAIKAVTVLKGA